MAEHFGQLGAVCTGVPHWGQNLDPATGAAHWRQVGVAGPAMEGAAAWAGARMSTAEA